ncbi:MAG TPA: ABC transporter ATP-binding protein [Armatimonadota bacterium]|jgi:subfamily B ATP-binding cassette protein MsbA
MLPHRSTLFAGLVCTAAVAGFDLAKLKLLEIVLNSLKHERVDNLASVAWIIGLVFLGRAVFSFGQMFLISDATQKMTRDLRDRVYAHIQSLPLRFFEDQRTGQLMASITADVPVLQETFQSGVIDTITAPIMVIGTMAAMLFYSTRLALTIIVIVPMMLFIIRKASKRMAAASRQIQENARTISDVLQETIAGVRVIKSFTSEESETRRFVKRSQDALRASMRAVRVRAILAPCVEVIGAGGFVVVLLIGIKLVVEGSITTGALGAFLLASNQLGANAKNLGNITLTLRRLDTAAQRVFALLDTKSDLIEKPDAVQVDRVEGDVEFRDVAFAYSDGPEVLHDLSFHAAPGEVVALVGPSGAGKSTIANLVPRFYDITCGSIRVDGRDVRDYTLYSLRRQIGIVPQETLLFSGTVKDNILYGRPEASDAEVRDAARAANADGFILGLPNGYDTVVGERGAKLSGGQRQRVAIARALLKDPRILILDEATSALDTESESLVQEALNTLMEGRTTLVIAHRLSTIRNADRILVMQSGRIVESGTHAALLEHGGLYRRLHEMQNEPDRTT